MTDFCSLHIHSSIHAELPRGIFKNHRKLEITFTDNESPERRASFERLRKKGVLKRVGLPRYHWSISSEGLVEGSDVYRHIKWVLDQIRPGFMISQLPNAGFECSLQFFWESNGTGAGPLLTPKIAELLVLHNINLQFGFYLAPRITEQRASA